jgi:hypothetical protein
MLLTAFDWYAYEPGLAFLHRWAAGGAEPHLLPGY